MGNPDTNHDDYPGFLSEMAVIVPREPVSPQSSLPRPRTSTRGQSGPDVPVLQGTQGQLIVQYSS